MIVLMLMAVALLAGLCVLAYTLAIYAVQFRPLRSSPIRPERA